MLVEASRAQVLVVDVQERLAPVIAGRDDILRNIGILLRAAAAHAVPVTLSEQYPKGLGPTLPEIAALTDTAALAKNAFSCLADPALRERILGTEREQVLVAGIEAHVCVLQTVMDLLQVGRTVFVVTDACGSRRDESHAAGITRMRDAGAWVVTTEMVVFELLRTAAAPAFRDMSRLIR
jgi:nicotinamidase-related amidase